MLLRYGHRARARSSAFSPTNLAGLALWLKADAGLFKDAAKAQPCTTDGDAVYTWADQSGNGRDAVQATAGRRPTYKVNIQNGLPVVRFDGTDDTIATSVFAALSQPTTIYIVLNCSDSGYATFIDGVAAGSRYVVGAPLVSGQVGLWANSSGFSANPILAPNVKAIWAAIFNGASSYIYKNASQAGTGTVGSVDLTGVKLCSPPAEGAFSAADFDELLIYSGAHDATQQAQVHTYLNNRWAVY